jgi:hypothetical protein
MTPRPSLLTLVALALPVLSVPVLLATTSGETAIRPLALVALAAAVVFAVLAGAGGRKPRPWLDLPLAAALGLAAGHILLAPGLPRGHDTFHHVWGVWAVAREAAAGDPYPLWVHGLGFGMPLLQFYGLTAFYVALPFSLAGLSPAGALKAAFVTFGVLAALGMYAAAARWTGDRRAALVAAAAYAFSPYRLLDSNYRLAFGESAGLAVLPLVFLCGMEAVREGGRRRLALAAAAVALLIVTHPISALIAALGLGIWTLVELRADRRLLMALARLAGVWILGTALAGFFVVPCVVEMKHTSVERLARGEERSLFLGYGLTPGDLLERRLWTGLLSTIPAQNPQDGTKDEMPYYFGLVLLALLPFGAGWDRTPRGLPWMTLAALALTLRPVIRVASFAFPMLAVLQFPWRFLGLAAFGAAALAGLAAARLLAAAHGRRWAVLVPGALAALLLLDAFPYTGAPGWFPAYQGLAYLRQPNPGCGRRWGCWEQVPIGPPYPLRSAGLLLPPTDPRIDTSYFCCAYTPLQTPAARLLSEPPRSPEVLARAGVGLFVRPGTQRLVRLAAEPYAVLRRGRQRGRSQPRPFTRERGEIRVELDGRPGMVLVLEEYFPGWQVLTPQGWRDVRPSRNGLLRARVEAGQREVRFRFHRWTPVRNAGWLLTGSTALALLALSAWQLRRKAAPPPDRG